MLPTLAAVEVFIGTHPSMSGCAHLRQVDDNPMLCGLHPEAGLLCDACAEMHVGGSHEPRACEVCQAHLASFLVPGRRQVKDMAVELPGGITWPFSGKLTIFGAELCPECAQSLLRTL